MTRNEIPNDFVSQSSRIDATHNLRAHTYVSPNACQAAWLPLHPANAGLLQVLHPLTAPRQDLQPNWTVASAGRARRGVGVAAGFGFGAATRFRFFFDFGFGEGFNAIDNLFFPKFGE